MTASPPFFPALLAVLALLPGTTPAQVLTVVNGSLGAQTAGQSTHVWAHPPTPGTVFDRWVGDTSALADPYAWHTTAEVPATPATVTATYRKSPVWTPERLVLNALPDSDPLAVNMIFHIPADPVGVIFLFHGSQGSAAGWFVANSENLAFARDAVAAGYGVVALDSADRVGRQWDNSTDASNADVANVQTAVTTLEQFGRLSPSLPKYAAGMSSGGGFAPKAAYSLGFSACAIWCSPGSPFALFRVTTVPTIWNLARYDNQVLHPDFLSNAQTNLGRLIARGVAGELRENPPSPVFPLRFFRIPEVSESQSLAIHANLKAGGFLDANDFLIENPETSNWPSALTAFYPPRIVNAIQEQLECCFSGHRFFADFTHKVIQFFGANRPPVPGRILIRSLAVRPDGAVQLTVAADPGQSCRIQTSTDLVEWETVHTVTRAEGTFDWLDTAPVPEPRRFYRVATP